MADNTSSYAANIAVRAFLTEFTGYYLNEVFGHDLSDGSYTRGGENRGKEVRQKRMGKHQKEVWWKCAYCGQKESPSQKLTVDHLNMFNRNQCGLQHPANVVPSCSPCNGSRRKGKPVGTYPDWAKKIMESGQGDYYTWEQQIVLKVLKSHANQTTYENRKTEITNHIKYYAEDNALMSDCLQKIAQDLYGKITTATACANEEAKTLCK
jgi:hypothetical protein